MNRLQEIQNSIEGNAIMSEIVEQSYRNRRIQRARPILTGMIGKYLPGTQAIAIADGLRGPEWLFFADALDRIKDIVDAMPHTYETNGQGDLAVCHLHYFGRSCDFYITELDVMPDLNQCFGYADNGQGPELGYISLPEILDTSRRGYRIELDLHFNPRPWSHLAR